LEVQIYRTFPKYSKFFYIFFHHITGQSKLWNN